MTTASVSTPGSTNPPLWCDYNHYLNGCGCPYCTNHQNKVAAGYRYNSAINHGAKASTAVTPLLPPPMPQTNPVWPQYGPFGVPVFPPEAFSDIQDLPKPPKGGKKLPPMNCIRCHFRNEYVGPEHLDELGLYTCRQCKGRS